jgi:dGTPase
VDSVKVKLNETAPAMSRVYIENDDLIRVETLKKIAYLMVIGSSRMRVAEYRGFEIVQELYEILSADGGPALLPSDIRNLYESLRDDHAKKRVICDFIACMTDGYASDFFNRLTGDTNTIFKPL